MKFHVGDIVQCIECVDGFHKGCRLCVGTVNYYYLNHPNIKNSFEVVNPLDQNEDWILLADEDTYDLLIKMPDDSPSILISKIDKKGLLNLSDIIRDNVKETTDV